MSVSDAVDAAQYGVADPLAWARGDQEWPLAFSATLIQQEQQYHVFHDTTICGSQSPPSECAAQRSGS